MKAIEHIKNGMANLAQPIPHGANLCFLAAIAELEKQPDLEAEIERLKEILIVLGETLRTKGEIHRPEPLVKPTWICFEESCHTQMEILIKQALKKGGE